jgi:hypothetical protein
MFKVPFFVLEGGLLSRLATSAYLYVPIIVSNFLPGFLSVRASILCVTLLGQTVPVRISRRLFMGLLVSMFLVVGAKGAHAQKVSGAIFTTDRNGQFVNANVYDSQEVVYLNGGPRPNQPCGAPGLPSGDYYFQVTDPSGKVLLSTDAIEERRVTVSNGMISSYNGSHAQATGSCGDVTVALYPYDPTPNEGGEYKVWMTPVGSYIPSEASSSYGFIASKSKTDNFKVLAPNIGTGPDSDGDGVPDESDLCPGVDDNSPECVPVS